MQRQQQLKRKRFYVSFPQCGNYSFFFSVTQILREIKVGESRASKFAISTRLQALNFNVHDFLHVLKAQMNQMNQILRS